MSAGICRRQLPTIAKHTLTSRMPSVLLCRTPEDSEIMHKHVDAMWKPSELWRPETIAHSINSLGDNGKEPGCLDIPSFVSSLRTKQLGRTLLYYSNVVSTQTIVKEKFRGIQGGLTCVADAQSAAKGRGKNVWSSPDGALAVSFKMSYTNGASLPFVQYLISLALVKAIKGLPGCESAPVAIKWPNDIYSGPHKIGGILCESDYANNAFDLVVGIGVNVTNEQPTISLRSLLLEAGATQDPPVTRESLLAAFFNQLEGLDDQFRAHGFRSFMDEYTQHWLHTDQRVVVAHDSNSSGSNSSSSNSSSSRSAMPTSAAGSSACNGDGGGCEGKEKEDEEGTVMWVKGISASTGCLRAEDAEGQMFELTPDGNSFDFFQGLIKRKVYY